MKEVLRAFYARYQSSGLASAAPLYYGHAPQDAVTPYLVYTLISHSRENSVSGEAGTDYYDTYLVQVSAFVAERQGISALLDLLTQVAAVFDETELSLGGGRVLLRCHRVTDRGPIEDPDIQTGGWQAGYDYQILTAYRTVI